MPSSYVVGEHFEAFIISQISQDRYASPTEALRADIQKGADSGDGIPAEHVLTRLESKYERMGSDNR